MLEVRRLNAGYGRAQVLFDLSLELGRGEVAVLAGRNGAGKSTTVKSIMGLLRPVSGEIRFEGEHIEKLEPFEISRLGLGYVPEDRRIFTDLSVAENLEVGRQPPRPGVPQWTEERLFALFPNLAGARDRLGAHLSGGEQKMLAIARTLMGNPAAILLDEPSEGIAPVIVRQMADTIVELKRAGMSVLLCEQNLNFARRIADRAYLIEKGQVREETIQP
ncbi:MAG: ABC transporter ATP-binding protein [Pseudomonadota bacterium]|nr:ABC transporter ATP-binding protein [Pseudomonadota bacterium]